MKKAVSGGMGLSFVFYMAVSVTGYMALGNNVPGDILTGFTGPMWVVNTANIFVLIHMLSAYQVFSQPVFHELEQVMTKHVPGVARWPPLVLRIVLRSMYVAVTTLVACSMPFFSDIIGFVGAIIFWPACVYFPVTMYLKVYKPPPRISWLLRSMNVTAAIVSVLAGIGAVQNIAADVQHYKMFGG